MVRELAAAPCAVFGLAAYEGERHLAEALESLLAQTRSDLAVLVVDDCSRDRTGEIAERYAGLDRRVSYVRNDRQLGLVGNWRRAFDLAGERFPAAPFFAWASDHDVWHPRWLELLAAELEAHPKAVFAYPLAVRIDGDGAEYPTRPHFFDTGGIGSPEERLRRTIRELAAAGDAIYGLGRREAMTRCGPFPLVVLPDRLFLARLALEGELRQVPRRLWYRRYRSAVAMSNRRQRRGSFPAGAPWWAFLPWPLVHAALVGRAGGGRLARRYLGESFRHAAAARHERASRRRRWRRRERRAAARSLLERLGLRAPPPPAPVARALTSVSSLAGLERAELLEDLPPGGVVVELGGGAPELAALVRERAPGAVHLVCADRGELPARVDLAVSLQGLPGEDVVGRLHELGAPALFAAGRHDAALRRALAARYWLRDVWLDEAWPGGRKPDPTRGPVGRAPREERHTVGRRRLVPDPEGAKLG